MFSRKKTIAYTENYSDKINKARDLINHADAIAVGIGSGMSASSGINYASPDLVKKWFPEYYKMGLTKIIEIQSVYWQINKDNELSYWGYWASHINHIRYEYPLVQGYKDLKNLLEGKNYFICTTNADGQVQKAGFIKNRIFAPQGNYCYFQCSKPCSDELYYNEEQIKKMIGNMPAATRIRQEDLPVCPHCGSYLIPNLRCDDKFVEKPHMKNLPDYESFIVENSNKKLVFLELGVGFNTPGIIRYPFEHMTRKYENAHLIRLNLSCAGVPEDIEDKSVSIGEDINKILADIAPGQDANGNLSIK